MHPEVQESKPGKCPKCGMTLVPVEGEIKHKGMDHTGIAGREMAKLMESHKRTAEKLRGLREAIGQPGTVENIPSKFGRVVTV